MGQRIFDKKNYKMLSHAISFIINRTSVGDEICTDMNFLINFFNFVFKFLDGWGSFQREIQLCRQNYSAGAKRNYLGELWHLKNCNVIS